ncbi:MAG: hypothetical protein PHQ62_04290 [Clostridia bacterium]|nr:hypothetical protein [Clostridia bacterium]
MQHEKKYNQKKKLSQKEIRSEIRFEKAVSGSLFVAGVIGFSSGFAFTFTPMWSEMLEPISPQSSMLATVLLPAATCLASQVAWLLYPKRHILPFGKKSDLASEQTQGK